MKIIFMGTPDFAVGTLRSLAEAGHEITLVVSQPDKPKGRGHAMVPTPVKAVAEELGIPVFQPVKIREAKDVLEKTEADVCVVAAFGQIIPASILHMKKYGACFPASEVPRSSTDPVGSHRWGERVRCDDHADG